LTSEFGGENNNNNNICAKKQQRKNKESNLGLSAESHALFDRLTHIQLKATLGPKGIGNAHVKGMKQLLIRILQRCSGQADTTCGVWGVGEWEIETMKTKTIIGQSVMDGPCNSGCDGRSANKITADCARRKQEKARIECIDHGDTACNKFRMTREQEKRKERGKKGRGGSYRICMRRGGGGGGGGGGSANLQPVEKEGVQSVRLMKAVEKAMPKQHRWLKIHL
jgi:hypothetical protein